MPAKTSQSTKMTIGKNVSALLERDEITRYRLAKEMDMSEATIHRICSGINVPGHDLMIKLADYFKVSTDYLYGRK